jgi:hypothetical protein
VAAVVAVEVAEAVVAVEAADATSSVFVNESRPGASPGGTARIFLEKPPELSRSASLFSQDVTSAICTQSRNCSNAFSLVPRYSAQL